MHLYYFYVLSHINQIVFTVQRYELFLVLRKYFAI